IIGIHLNRSSEGMELPSFRAGKSFFAVYARAGGRDGPSPLLAVAGSHMVFIGLEGFRHEH
ncbi:MAG: hypothetical protein K6T26_03520, partial [Alicyclobacillus sp.]|nr:hypothetical protein [Alicyclobacillus sp.]